MTTAPQTLPNPNSRIALWAVPVAAIAGILLALAGYVGLPMLGVSALAGLLSAKPLVAIVAGLAALGVYAAYLHYILRKPMALLVFITAFWAPVEYANIWALYGYGINIHFRLVLWALMGVPAILLAIRHAGLLNRILPQLKYLMLFGLVLLFFFLFRNAHAAVTTASVATLFSDGIDVVQLTAYINCFFALLIGAVVMATHANPRAAFDRLNKTLMWVSIPLAALAIYGYVTNNPWFSVNLDGFHRATGIFTQPNPFGHHEGMLLLYLLGMFCYYQGRNASRMPKGLLSLALMINTVAFLLALSKSAIALLLVTSAILFLLNLSSPPVRQAFGRGIVALIVLVPLALFAYQILADQSLLDVLESRVEKVTSFSWRLQIWSQLLSGMDGLSLLIGNGFTSANDLVYQMSYNDRTNAKPLTLVHNGYIALLFDFGVLGWLYFVAVFRQMGAAFVRLRRPDRTGVRPLLTIVIALSVYFLAVCGVDEMATMFDAAILFWTWTAMLTTLAQREVQA